MMLTLRERTGTGLVSYDHVRMIAINEAGDITISMIQKPTDGESRATTITSSEYGRAELQLYDPVLPSEE